MNGTPISCPTCKETYIAVASTDDAEARAAAEGPRCCVPVEDAQ